MIKDKQTVIGEITVELHKKHGIIEKKTENLVTDFGRGFILTRGLQALFNSNTSQLLNQITFQTDAGFTTPSESGRVCNLLLHNPKGISKSCYLPADSELTAYAYRDSASASKEGSVTEIKAGTAMKKQLTRRYSYGSSISGQFNVIATSLKAPDGTGAVDNIQIPIAEENYSTKSTELLAAGKLLFTTSSGTYQFDLETGETSAYSGSLSSFNGTIISTFVIKNYTYVFRNYVSSMQSKYYIDGFDNTGTKVIDSMQINADYGGRGVIIYDETADKYYFINKSGSTVYEKRELEVNSSGLITGVTTVADAPTIGSVSYDTGIIGDDTNGYVYKNNNNQVYSDYSFSTVILTNTVNMMYKGLLINFDYVNITGAMSGGNRAGLTVYGNLLSYHEFSTPFTKDAGDTLYVSYSYYID